MIPFYAEIKDLHIGAALASGALFFVRGFAVQIGQRWPMRPALRHASYSIDSILLASAIVLLSILPGATFANHWLAAKLALIACYILCGSLALKRSRTTGIRHTCFAVACLLYVTILDVALRHDPLGPLRILLS